MNYIILGIIQGIFEWIPISSQGVTALASQFLIKGVPPVEMALFLHLGTFLAVLLYFRKDWFEVIRFKNKNLLRFLIISSIISGAVAFALYGVIKNMVIGNSLLIITGFGLLFTAYFHKKKKTLDFNFNKLAVVAGLLQGLAVVPGLSRSGATIFGLSFGNLKPKEVLKLSYIMSAPPILGMAGFLFFKNPILFVEAWPALIFSFLTGLASLSFLLKISAKINFFKFALIFALLCFLGAGFGLLA